MDKRKLLAGLGLGGVLALGPLISNGSHAAGLHSAISFTMVQSNPAVVACLPKAKAVV